MLLKGNLRGDEVYKYLKSEVSVNRVFCNDAKVVSYLVSKGIDCKNFKDVSLMYAYSINSVDLYVIVEE